MENFAQGIVAGFAFSSTITVMYYFNKAALGTLFAVNGAIGKALRRVIIPPKHTCNDDDCEAICCRCGCDHYSCYDCEKLKP